MKQKKFGKKIQNWHRPLGPSQLRQRFLKHRYDDPAATKRELGLDYYPVGDDPFDAYWNCYDPFSDPYYECFEVDSDDIQMYVMEKSLGQILNPSFPFLQPEWLADSIADDKSEAMVSLEVLRQIAGVAIEERLARYLEKVAHFSQYSDSLESRIREAIGDRQNLEVVKRVGADSQSPDLALRACLLAPFWVRSPQTWDQNGGERAFLGHLFTFYDVPGFLYSEWFRGRDGPRFKWLCWFIVFGQGGSLKHAGELFGWRIPNRFQYYLQDVPAHMSPTEACILAEVKRLGGREIDAARVLRNLAFVIDPTEHSANASHSDFWHETVRWLINHRDAITDEQSDLILSWAMHEYTEAEREHTRPFSWKGRSLPAILERSIEYRRLVERPWSQYKWNGHGWDWVMDQAPLGRWSFTELTSGEELFREGEAMRHCVATYAARCVSGYSAIVSIRLDDIRRITVEINPKTKQVVQARGPFNRVAQTEEKEVMWKWMRAVVKPNTSQAFG